MVKLISILTLLLIIYVASYGQVRVALSTKVTDPLVYKSTDADSRVKKSLDSLAAILRKEIRDSFSTVLPIDNYTIIKNAKGQGSVQSKWVDSIAKKAVDLTATNARIDSTIKALNGLNSAVWKTISGYGTRLDSMIVVQGIENANFDALITALQQSGAITTQQLNSLKVWADKVDAALKKPILQ